MKAIGYVRVSTVDQVESGVSLDNQKKTIEAFCTMKGYDLIKVVEDPAVSTKKMFRERDGGKEVLRVIQQRDIQHVVVMKLDRAFRSTTDCLETAKIIEENNVGLHLLDINVDTTTPIGKFFLTITAAFAELERGRICERVREGMQYKIDQGESTGTAPIGKRKVEGQSMLADNESEIKAILLIKSLKEKGLSLSQIANVMNSSGIPARGKQWYKTTISRVLQRS
jgi:DNA invertase Pin-like site-specific DNA recombinase